LAISTLVARYFYDPLKNDEAKDRAFAASAAAFIRTDYFPEFRSHLEKLRKASEPRPGQEGQMLYQCGVRDGIDMVLNHLNDLLNKVKETHE
jgi:hypothetical protein